MRLTKRTVAGCTLTRHDDGQWWGLINGVSWIFYQEISSRIWRGYTVGHETGCPRQRTLKAAVEWVQANKEEIAAKVAARKVG